MKNLDPYVIPLNSINLIEASAGTGKSWTVTLLYLRLILEKGLTVDQILVVTFTDAATKELRDDIRHRLTEALDAFETPDYVQQNEDEYSRLISDTDDNNRDEYIRRLKRAKLSLDEAAIFTIHGFCQRSLSENAFQAGLPFESELMDDDYELMQKLTDDFWRRHFHQAPAALLFKLQQKSITPDSLLADIYTAVGKPYLEILTTETPQANNQQWDDLEAKFHHVMEKWKAQREEISALLRNPDLKKAYLANLSNCCDYIFSVMDSYACLKQLPTEIDTKTHWLGLKEKTRKNFDSIKHPFFDLWQDFLNAWAELEESSDAFLNQIRIKLLRYLQEELPKEKRRLGVLSFDDLLLQLQQSLRTNPDLAKSIRKKYKAALIDEFQDTDPIQYEIFSTIFSNQPEHAVFLVGDPKQAIYSFRGGDIHTYLKAKADTSANNHYTLKTNWRSHPDLISAFNALYADSENPFRDKGIEYIQVEAGNRVKDELITPDNRSPLRFWELETVNQETDEKKSSVTLREEIASATAGDIASLLKAAQQGKAKIGDQAISGGDIAILVRSHSQGDLIKRALGAQGIASVQSSKDSIFHTHEATEMHRLLTAIADPQREDNIRRALVTDLMGHNAADLRAYEDDSTAWENKLLAMQQWHQKWQKKGFLPMMRDLMRSEKTHQKLLAYEDGERRLTNILHLSELIHQQSKQQSFSMEELLRWLQQQRQNVTVKDAELRLESDKKLVKIVTIHKSKGLEYPIVYCPFVGISNRSMGSKEIFIFHQDDKACLEIGSKDAKKHLAIKAQEDFAEDCRLLYVALTRAKYQCTLVCVPNAIYRSPDRTALGWLLTNGKTVQSDKQNYFQAYAERLAVLSARQEITLEPLPAYAHKIDYQQKTKKQVLSARSFTADINDIFRITSFSGLTAHAHSEAPDYDASVPQEEAQSIIAVEDDFPRGATAGTALHEIFENIDFTIPVAEQTEVISDILKKWAFESRYESSASTLIENTLQLELFTGFKLNQLDKQNRLDEMEFYLPLDSLEYQNLQQILYKHLPENWQVVRNAIEKTLSFDKVEGYLKGYIDLIFEHNGKYYLADYKSNTLDDYHQESLLNTMASSHYYLQYLLYCVALHRYLQKHLIDYSWEDHFGGAFYLFIRGINPSNPQNNKNVKKGGDGQSHNSLGVFYHKPTLELISAMDNLFAEALLK